MPVFAVAAFGSSTIAYMLLMKVVRVQSLPVKCNPFNIFVLAFVWYAKTIAGTGHHDMLRNPIRNQLSAYYVKFK